MFLATCVSVISLLFYSQRGEVLLYGDAIAHINIARRIFDSLTPGLLQLGTVWLPLPHLLMVPFLIFNPMWQRGVGGSIPSMAAYVLAVMGIFRLVRGTFWSPAVAGEPATAAQARYIAAHAAAWTAALVFAANPNLIYMQTTAMGESIYLACFVWSVVYFGEYVRRTKKSPTKCGLCLFAACLTRYDGWFLAAAMAAVILPLAFFSHEEEPKTSDGTPLHPQARPPSARNRAIKFTLLAASAPVLWLIYNGVVYRNPLEFANGPYSARAIEQRTQNPWNPGHPGSGRPISAELYFVKAAEDNVATIEWMQRTWVGLLFAAIVVAIFMRRRRCAPLLFLLLPLPFYALSVAYGAVPIFVPQWWPFSHYNVRYGLELLPAFAVALSILVFEVAQISRVPWRLRAFLVLVVLAFAFVSYGFVWRDGPVTLREAQINMRGRNQFEAQLASLLRTLPPDSTFLMYLGDHVGALERAGIPLHQVINEGNHRPWKKPSDPDGLWERALADPEPYANYVIAFEGDPVWQAMQKQHLQELLELHVTGQARAILYRVR
jgi:hypothetical protein